MSIRFEDALKAKKIRRFFEEKGRIYIVVDATTDDVLVPDFLHGDPALRLVLNTRMPQPIYIRDGFVESNFSFSGVAHHCVIPMGKIWAAYVPEQEMEEGLIWQDSIPETVKIVLEAVDEIKDDEHEAPVQPTLVMNNVNTPVVDKKKSGETEKKKRKTGHLRIVK